MNTWIKVARFQLADRLSYTALPWGILAVNFAIWYVLAGSFGGGGAQVPAYSVCAIYVVYLFVGMFSIFRSLPFAFALGVSRGPTTAAPSCSRPACPRSTGCC